ncbi:MAG: DUF192 domain-containing protein [Roseibium sp.]
MGLRMFSKPAVGLIAMLGAALTTGPAAADESQKGLPVEQLVVTSGDREHVFTVEVASTDRQRAMGLMFREEMDAEAGMLFLFDAEGERYFWMKNTPLPLDIIYIAASGSIVSIAADTVPFSTDAIPSGAPAKYVLELNAGTAAKRGIVPGDRVASPSIAAE